jgi:long-chain acyl-CoA synthetase
MPRAQNLGLMLMESCEKHASRIAMLVPKDKGFAEITYGELRSKVRAYASAIQSLGIRRGDRACIQSENCVEWAIFDWACQTLGVVVVPIYPTLPADQSRYIVSDSGARFVFAGSADQMAKSEGIPEVQCHLLRGPSSLDENSGNAPELEERGWLEGMRAIQPDDVATIIYTSGTTGNPKGAMIPHRAATSIVAAVPEFLPFGPTDRFLSFLPMSHVFERVAGQFLPIGCGASIAYAKSLMTLANDMAVTQPTIILCVPRFLEATRDKITDAAAKYPPLRRKLFQWALAQGVRRAQGKFAPFAGILDRLVGAKIRARMGGRIRFLVSGGAALPPHVAEFYMGFRLNVLQGYGLTETTAASCVNHPDRNKYWTVGEPLPGVQVEVAEDGEILIRGDSVMLGYYNLPEQTSEAIDSAGWFHTGDIGEWEGGNLKITDRKKDLLILANGKNVAPQPIENRLKESELIQEAVLFGDGSEYVYGLILPNFERARKALADAGTALPESDEELVKLDAFRALVREEVSKVNKTLADFEKVKKHEPIAATFSVDTGELTPSLKVKRKVVRERYRDVLAALARG